MCSNSASINGVKSINKSAAEITGKYQRGKATARQFRNRNPCKKPKRRTKKRKKERKKEHKDKNINAPKEWRNALPTHTHTHTQKNIYNNSSRSNIVDNSLQQPNKDHHLIKFIRMLTIEKTFMQVSSRIHEFQSNQTDSDVIFKRKKNK